jgi:hypothetical protein
MTPAEHDFAAFRFYEALEALMVALQGLAQLRGTLGLQDGIGGRLSAAAHYLPASRQLALTKTQAPAAWRTSGFTPLTITWVQKPFVRLATFSSRPMPGWMLCRRNRTTQPLLSGLPEGRPSE